MQKIPLQINESFDHFYSVVATQATVLLPDALLALVFILVGWIVASISHWLVMRILNFFAVDKLAAKTPLSSVLRSVGIVSTVSQILGRLVFWSILLFTFAVAAEKLHLRQVSFALGLIANFLPRLIAAMVIIIVGMLIAKFLQMFTVQAMGHIGVTYQKLAGRIVQTMVLIFVFATAIDQLGFRFTSALNAILLFVLLVLFMLGLGLAIGARTVLDNVVACQQIKRQLAVGAHVHIQGIEGTVKQFTLTSILLDVAGVTTVLPATSFLTQTYTVRSS
jgi:hypothetical protein